ncbi:MAG: ribonuclease P protein component [Devosia sp.]|nr:ribonuclease P protein component [Devosia sp.]
MLQEAHVRRLRNRSEFLRVARGSRVGRSAFSLQTNDSDAPEPGMGFTVTKQAGNSPERNRIRRRLRAAARACATQLVSQHDYVLVGRRDALSIKFDRLVADLAAAIPKVHARKKN